MSEWIKFSERKPERGQLIVTANDYGAQWVEKYSGSEYPGYYWISISPPPKRSKFDEWWDGLVKMSGDARLRYVGDRAVMAHNAWYDVIKIGFLAGQAAGKDEE